MHPDKKVSRAAFGGQRFQRTRQQEEWLSSRCDSGEDKQRRWNGCGRLLESKQFALLDPVDWQFQRQSHQLFGGELRRILAIDHRRNDVGRQ